VYEDGEGSEGSEDSVAFGGGLVLAFGGGLVLPEGPVSWCLTVGWSSPKGPVSCRQLQGMSLVCRTEGVGLSMWPDFLTCDGKWWCWGEIPKEIRVGLGRVHR